VLSAIVDASTLAPLLLSKLPSHRVPDLLEIAQRRLYGVIVAMTFPVVISGLGRAVNISDLSPIRIWLRLTFSPAYTLYIISYDIYRRPRSCDIQRDIQVVSAYLSLLLLVFERAAGGSMSRTQIPPADRPNGSTTKTSLNTNIPTYHRNSQLQH
jgi:hypothetical protein